MSRKSTRVTRSKYFTSDESEITDKNKEDDDLDYNPILESGCGKVVAKTRKRKSADASVVVGETDISKRTRQSKAKAPKKKSKNAKSDANSDMNNNNNTPNKPPLLDPGTIDDSEGDEDWEEVPDANIFDSDAYQPNLPTNLKITLEKPKKEKTPGDWIEAYIRQV